MADETGEAVCNVFFRQIVLIDIDDGWFAVCAGVAVVQREKAVSVVFLGEKCGLLLGFQTTYDTVWPSETFIAALL